MEQKNQTSQLISNEEKWYDSWRYIPMYRQFVYTYFDPQKGQDVTQPLWMYAWRASLENNVPYLLDILMRGDYFSRLVTVNALALIDYSEKDYINILLHWRHAESMTDVIPVSPTLLSRDVEFKALKMACSNALWRIHTDDDEQKRQIDAFKKPKKGQTVFANSIVAEPEVEELTPNQIKIRHEMLLWFKDFDPTSLAMFEAQYLNKPLPKKEVDKTPKEPEQLVMQFKQTERRGHPINNTTRRNPSPSVSKSTQRKPPRKPPFTSKRTKR